MRRKVKQLLATGMALAVLAVGAVSANAAVSAQTADAAQPQSVEDVDEYAWHQHTYTKFVGSGWDGPLVQGGHARPWVKFQCTAEKDCKRTWTYYGERVSPKHTSATCTANETYTYPAQVVKGYTVSEKVDEVANTKKDHNYTGISWEKGTADEYGNGTMTLTLTCKDCKYEYTETVCANSNSYTAAKCGVNAKYTYAAGSFQTMVNGKGYAYNEEIELEVPGTALEHSFKNYVYNNDATCTKDGTKTATCDRDHCSATNTVTVEGSKLNHNYGNMDNNNVTFNFSEDGKTAVATVTCVRAGCTASEDGHTYTEDAKVTAEVTKPATCTEWGVTTYTATYENASASVDKTDIKPLGHDFTDYDFHWVDEETCMEAIAQLSCSRCEGVTETIPAEVTVDRVANCTTTGKKTHKASLYIDGELYETLSKEFYPAALGHLYTGATLAWDDNTYMTATASLDCQREGCGHVEKETVNALIIPKVAPTCTETGVDIHRVTYSLEGEEVARLEEEVTVKALDHKFLNYVSDGNATCTKDGTKTAVCERQNCNATDTVNDEGSALGHDYGNKDNSNVTFTFSEDGKTAVATVTCVRAGCTASEDGHTYTADAVVTSKVTKPATCTEMGETTYTAVYENASAAKTVVDVPALGHSFTDYRYDNNATCEGDGSQTATCDRCDATDTKSVPGSAACTLHEVDNAKVCPICGKVNGIVKLNKVSAAADDSASVYSAQLVVRVGTLPNGRKIITVTFLNAEGQAITLYDAQKIRVSLAALNAQLGETGAQSFAHTLTSLNTANGEKSNVGFAVENGTLIFDAPFQSSNACVLLVD